MKPTQRSARGRRGPYRLARRAERTAETRRRITQAAVELHERLGPLATTVSAIAERAGVGRPTVYAHFPDEPTLFAACTAHYFAAHQPPDPMRWLDVRDPEVRLRRGLTELYRYWVEIEPMAAAVLRDQRVAPQRVGQGLIDYVAGCRKALGHAWQVDGATGRRLRAAIGHAVRFETWKGLVPDEGLAVEEAVDIMMVMVRGIVGRTSRSSAITSTTRPA